MSGSGPIYEYQRELTAKLEQALRERDEARAARDHFKEQLRERAEALLDARAEIERFRNAVREKERLELAAVQELDEARACLAFERVTVAELRAEVERLRGDKAEVSSARLSAAFTEGTLAAGDAMRDKLRTVAERQREACARRFYKFHLTTDMAEFIRATPLVTEGDK